MRRPPNLSRGPSRATPTPTASLCRCRRKTVFVLNKFSLKKCFFVFINLLAFVAATVPFPDGEAADGTKYKTAYRCEGESMTIFCDPGETIQVIRANYGRFSIAICNKHGYTDWSVNCMSTTTTRVLQRRCDTRRRCEIDVSSSVFGDPCPGTHKYVEIHYACVSQNSAGGPASAKSSTPRLPPWLLEGGASNLWSTNAQDEVYDDEVDNGGDEVYPPAVVGVPPILVQPTDTTRTSEPSSSPSPQRKPILVAQDAITPQKEGGGPRIPITTPKTATTTTTESTTTTTTTSATTISGQDSDSDDQKDGSAFNPANGNDKIYDQTSVASSDDIKETKEVTTSEEEDRRRSSTHCRPTLSRRLHWNWTRAGEVAIQPCPAGATGLARWSCQNGGRKSRASQLVSNAVNDKLEDAAVGNDNVPQWKGSQPDMSDCKSKDMTDLEARVRQQDPENVLASTLAHLTEKKFDEDEEDDKDDRSGVEPKKRSHLYGGDLEASVAVVKAVANRLRYLLQTQSDSFYNKESYVQEVFQNILRSASNLLSPDSRASWLDLSRPQRLKVASALMRCLEEHAFLVADVIRTPETVVEATKRAVTSISVIDTQSTSFLSQNQTSFPSSTSSSSSSGNATSSSSSNGTTTTTPNRVNQQSKKSTATSTISPNKNNNNSNGNNNNNLLNDWTDVIRLPHEAIRQLRTTPAKEEQKSLAKVVFYAYKNLHQLLSDADQQLTNLETLEGEQLVVNSRVISASIDGTLSSVGEARITEPVTIHFQHLQKTTASLDDAVCVYWDLDEDTWINRGCKVVETNSSHTECQCYHLTSFALLTASSGLVGSEVARSIGSGILFDSDSATSGGSDSTATSSTTTTHVLTLEIATYLVSTVCLLILILILVQFRHQIRRGLKRTSCCSGCCVARRQHAVKGHHDDIIDKTHHQLYASTAGTMANNLSTQVHLEQALSTSNGSSSGGSTSSTGTCSSASVDPNKRMMQSMVTIRPHQAQAKVMVLPTEPHQTLDSTKTTTTSWFKTGKLPTTNKTNSGLTSIIKSKLRTGASSQSQNTAHPQDNLLCTLPRTTLQRRPANSAHRPTTPKLGGRPSGPRPLHEQQSMVTVNPYDVNLSGGVDGIILNGCDTDDSSDSQYASVANLPSPTSHKRPLQQQQHYYTTRLQPTRQSHQQEQLQQRQGGNRNPYVSPQLSRLTSTLRSYGYNPMETCSNSSNCSSPQRTALTNLSSSSTTVSSAQLGSPYHFLGSRFHHQNDGNSEILPNTESTMLGHETSHVYCEIPIPLTSSPRNAVSCGTGNYDNVRWVNQTANRGRTWQPVPPPPKYCRETDEEETLTYAEDTVCDMQNVSDLSEDEQHQQQQHYQQQHHRQQQQHRVNNLKSNECDFWLNSLNSEEQIGQTHPFPLSENLPREGVTSSKQMKSTKKRGGENKSSKRTVPGVGVVADSQIQFTTKNSEEEEELERKSNNQPFNKKSEESQSNRRQRHL